MEEKRLANRIIQNDCSIIQALKKMDNERVKLLLVFDQAKFLGILTIGDIQRSIIHNKDLNSSVSEILDLNKEYASIQDSEEKIKSRILTLRAECMPVTDGHGNLVKVYFWEDFWKENKVADNRKIDIPVIIMAGGKGTRLKPLTNVIPKPLIPVGEKTILEVILEQFNCIGCRKFYMSVNYKAEILEYYLNNLDFPFDVEFFKEEKPLGTIGSVSLLKDKITTPFFVSNCDILIDQDFREVYDYHCHNGNDITLVVAVKSFQIPYGVIKTGEDGIMAGLVEKPELTYLINTGVYILQPELINRIPENEFYHITDLINSVRQGGGKVGCFPVSEKSWTDIGDWNEYMKLIAAK